MRADDRVPDVADVVEELVPLVVRQQPACLATEPGVGGAVERLEPDVDVVGVIGHRVGLAAHVHQRDDLVRLDGSLKGEQAPDREVPDRSGPLVPEDRDVVDLRDVNRVPDECSDTFPEAV